MPEILFYGFLDLPWWGYVLVVLALTQTTIASVTLYLHRSQAHLAVEFYPALVHFFRFWLWLTTGMRTKEWVAIHRKHHAKCETVEDPHSPQVLGINRVLWGGVFLYVKESHKKETMECYGHGTPDDWVERNLYSRFTLFGPTLMGLIDVACFGFPIGLPILAIQLVWIPFWAAGVINGAGHYWGYRNFEPGKYPHVYQSRNLWQRAFWIGGEELHNNHHQYPASARFSVKRYEFDLGWSYIRILESLGLAFVKRAYDPDTGCVVEYREPQTSPP